MVHGLRTVRVTIRLFWRVTPPTFMECRGSRMTEYLNVFLNIFDPSRIHPRLLSALAVRYVVTPETDRSKDFHKVP